jgi:Asp-tRNA(Asn)/Glu-tRNA(Gln) amidotransferase A subunit family amidase
MARTVRDTARLLDVIAGYDANDPVTAAATGHTALSYTIFLDAAGLRGARIGVIRQPMDVNVDPAAPEYLKVRAVIDRACADLRRLGAVLVDPLEIPDLIENQRRVYLDNKHETEAAIDRYLAELVDPPVRTLRAITESGKVVPFRNRQMQGVLGLTTEDPDYLQVLLHKAAFQWQVLQLMADHGLDALVYATSDYPQTPVTEAALTDERLDDNYGIGNNRRFSPALGFPALTVPAGFTPDGMPVGLEFMGRPFAEGTLFRLGYAYEQGTRHRRPPPATP